MRYYEISGGFRVSVSQEEQEIIDLFSDEKEISKADLNERQREIARLMVSRGLLNRKKSNVGAVMLCLNDDNHWRY
jgi:hypothetical protein